MSKSARAVTTFGAQAHKYPLKLAADFQNSERDCIVEDQGIRKTTPKDKVKAAITNVYTNNNLLEAKRLQNRLGRKLAREEGA